MPSSIRTPEIPEWLTVAQVARHISASRSFVRKAIRLGRLRAANIGLGHERAELRISHEALVEFMRAAAMPQEAR